MARPIRTAAILIGAASLLWLALAVSVAQILGEGDPQRALRIAPFAARAQARLALDRAPDAIARRRTDGVVALATDALRRDPTMVDAAIVLGMVAVARGRDAAADRAFAYSDMLSRRDSTTQLWLIERAVARGDVGGALGHYDVLLRRVPEMRTELYPVMIAASADPVIASGLNRLLRERAPWAVEFAGQLASAGPDARTLDIATAGFFDLKDRHERAIFGDMLARMVDLGDYDRAWARYRQGLDAAGAADAPLRDGDFREADPVVPFGWRYAIEDGAPERRDGADGRPVLFLPPGGDAPVAVARQLLRLAPGGYALGYRAGAIPADSGERPAIDLACAVSKADVAHIVPPAGDGAARGVRAGLRIPSGCADVWLTITMPAATTPDTGREPAWIGAMTLRRAE